MRRLSLSLLVVLALCLSSAVALRKKGSKSSGKSTPQSTEPVTVTVVVFPNAGNDTAKNYNGRHYELTSVEAALAELGPFFRYTEDRELILRNSTGHEILQQDVANIHPYEAVFVCPVDEWWLWPAIHLGRHVPLRHIYTPWLSSPLIMETVSTGPRVFQVKKFLTPAECDAIISLSRADMFDSGVYNGETTADSSALLSDARNSKQAWLHETDKDAARVMSVINERIEQLTRVPSDLGEGGIQVVHYEPGQHYWGHYDYFDPELYSDLEDVHGGRNRFITVLLYLNEVEEGGETSFPLSQPNTYEPGERIDNSDCTRGLQVKPSRGSIVVFYNLVNDFMNGQLDPRSLHMGCDVIKGEKWAANKWIWNKAARDKPEITPLTSHLQRAGGSSTQGRLGSGSSGGKKSGTSNGDKKKRTKSAKKGRRSSKRRK